MLEKARRVWPPLWQLFLLPLPNNTKKKVPHKTWPLPVIFFYVRFTIPSVFLLSFEYLRRQKKNPKNSLLFTSLFIFCPAFFFKYLSITIIVRFTKDEDKIFEVRDETGKNKIIPARTIQTWNAERRLISYAKVRDDHAKDTVDEFAKIGRKKGR